MERVDFVSHWYDYDDTETKIKYGQLCLKDRDIVYCLTDRTEKKESGSYFIRSQGGLIQIYSTQVIGDFNDNMGGVDFADTGRLHLNLKIMGLNWWWLKLFFIYLNLELIMPWYFKTSYPKNKEKKDYCG